MMKPDLAYPGYLLALLAVIFLATACSDGSDGSDNNGMRYLKIANPMVEPAPDIGVPVLPTVTFDLADQGYQQMEYFLSGNANAFTSINELGTDGNWEVEPGETADYKTRILVYRPINEADFSGTVLLEWLNVTAGADLAPSWNAGHTGILRDGHVWIGVSAQIAGVEGTETSLLPPLKEADPERYASLFHPGDSFSYDIFSQAAQAIREPIEIDVLEGLSAGQIIAFGESQSASRMVTYINAAHPLYNTFDGYMVHSRGDGSSALAQDPLTPIPTPESVKIRTDLNVPVMTFQTETDLFNLGFITDRQDDSNLFRLWEVAGTAHGDNYTSVTGFDDDGTDPIFAVVMENDSIADGLLTCDSPLNNGPQSWTFNAAVLALADWVENGTLPPVANRLAVTDDLSAFRYDELGNVLGGIRTPYVDAAAAVLSGEGQGGGSFCFLFGTTELLDATQMASRYIDKAGYVQAVTDATDDAVAKGFLLTPDADRIKAAAPLQWDMLSN
jgi:hypothetical protein